MKKEVPLFITFITGILLVIALFVPHKPFGQLQSTFNDWLIIVGGFTMILGLDSLLLHHWEKIRRRKEGWISSLALILSFCITLIWGFGEGIFFHRNPFSPSATFLRYFYTYVFVPLQATMFSLLAFFIASAAYRAFRAKDPNATLLLSAAALVMLGRVPGGNNIAPYVFGIVFLLAAYYFASEGAATMGPTRYIYYGLAITSLILIYPAGLILLHYLNGIADWIMNIPQMAAKRGIWIGISLGGIAMSLRIILGIERTYLQ